MMARTDEAAAPPPAEVGEGKAERYCDIGSAAWAALPAAPEDLDMMVRTSELDVIVKRIVPRNYEYGWYAPCNLQTEDGKTNKSLENVRIELTTSCMLSTRSTN